MASESQTSSGKVELHPNMDFLSFALAQKPKEEITEESPIIFYCKACAKIQDVEKIGNRLKFRCKACKSENITFGTSRAIKKFYHL